MVHKRLIWLLDFPFNDKCGNPFRIDVSNGRARIGQTWTWLVPAAYAWMDDLRRAATR